VGSCTIRRYEYDVNKDGGADASGVDGSKYDMTSTMSMRMPAAWMRASKMRREDQSAL